MASQLVDGYSRKMPQVLPVVMESIMLTIVIDAKEGWDVMMVDVPRAFIQTKMSEMKKGKDQVIMKITGVLIDLMVDLFGSL
jgi:hypothetical protein